MRSSSTIDTESTCLTPDLSIELKRGAPIEQGCSGCQGPSFCTRRQGIGEVHRAHSLTSNDIVALYMLSFPDPRSERPRRYQSGGLVNNRAVIEINHCATRILSAPMRKQRRSRRRGGMCLQR